MTAPTAMVPIPALEPAAIRAAAASIDPVFLDAPQYVHEGLSARLGVPVIVKVETPTRSGPSRAAARRSSSGRWLPRAGSAPIGRSSALGGQLRPGHRLRRPRAGHPVGRVRLGSGEPRQGRRMRALGADVIQVGEDFDGARAGADAHAARTGAHLVIDGDDPRIAAGAGTLAVELTDAVEAGRLPAPAIVSVPSATAR
jgi:threonine dehydratase